MMGVIVHTYSGYQVFYDISKDRYFAGDANSSDPKYASIFSGTVDGIHQSIDSWINNKVTISGTAYPHKNA